MAEKTLWEQFNLGEFNPDPGGGILYCLRYDTQELKVQHGYIVKAIQSMDVKIQDLGNRIRFIPKKPLKESEGRRLLILLEELTVLNDAIHYKEGGFEDVHNLGQLYAELSTAYWDFLGEGHNKVKAYDLVSVLIPEIVRDIRIADCQNQVLSSTDKKTLTELIEFAEVQERQLNKGGFLLFVS